CPPPSWVEQPFAAPLSAAALTIRTSTTVPPPVRSSTTARPRHCLQFAASPPGSKAPLTVSCTSPRSVATGGEAAHGEECLGVSRDQADPRGIAALRSRQGQCCSKIVASRLLPAQGSDLCEQFALSPRSCLDPSGQTEHEEDADEQPCAEHDPGSPIQFGGARGDRQIQDEQDQGQHRGRGADDQAASSRAADPQRSLHLRFAPTQD